MLGEAILLGTICKVELYPNYIVAGYSKNIVKSSTCPKKISHDISSLLSRSQGTLTNRHLERILKQKVKIKPQKITVTPLREALLQQNPLPKNWYFIKPQLDGNAVAYASSQQPKIVCHDCSLTGSKRFQVNIGEKTVWGKVKVAIQTDVLITTSSISANASIPPTGIRTKKLYSTSPEKFFKRKGHIHFYKTNKAIREGTPIKTSDLTGVNLVHANRPAKLILNSNYLNLSSTALPLRAGKIGDTIQLKTMKNNKTIVGKVVNFNKVRVEL